MFDSPALSGFAGETRRDQALVLLGGALACLVGYVAVALLVAGDPSPAAGTGRRAASAGASAACWGYYALAFVRGRGGPVLDTFVYPLATVGVVRTLLRVPGFEFSLGALSVRAVLLDPLLSAAAALLPGIACFTLVLWVWGARLDEDGRQEWIRQHLTEAFRTEFVEAD